jgi:hypothetical protein
VFTPPAPKKRNGILKVGIQPVVVPDHVGKARIAKQGSALRPERVKRSDWLDEVERRRSSQQARHFCRRHVQSNRQFRNVARPGLQRIEKIKLDAGGQHLRIDKPGDNVEEAPRPAMGDAARQREISGKPLKTWI